MLCKLSYLIAVQIRQLIVPTVGSRTQLSAVIGKTQYAPTLVRCGSLVLPPTSTPEHDLSIPRTMSAFCLRFYLALVCQCVRLTSMWVRELKQGRGHRVGSRLIAWASSTSTATMTQTFHRGMHQAIMPVLGCSVSRTESEHNGVSPGWTRSIPRCVHIFSANGPKPSEVRRLKQLTHLEPAGPNHCRCTRGTLPFPGRHHTKWARKGPAAMESARPPRTPAEGRTTLSRALY